NRQVREAYDSRDAHHLPPVSVNGHRVDDMNTKNWRDIDRKSRVDGHLTGHANVLSAQEQWRHSSCPTSSAGPCRDLGQRPRPDPTTLRPAQRAGDGEREPFDRSDLFGG